HAAAFGVRFEAQRAVEVRAVHLAVFDEDVAHAARNLAAHHDAAVPVLHDAIADDDVFGRRRDEAYVVVPARFDRDTIVARVGYEIFDQHVASGLRIAAVIVRAVTDDSYAAHRHVRAEHGMNLPHRRIVDRDAFNQDVAAAIGLDEVRPQPVAVAEHALGHRRAPVVEFEQPADALPARTLPRPPAFIRFLSID